jgi:hypothetical protein
MTKLVLACASLIAVSTLAHAQEAGVQITGQALRLSKDTLHCTKCVLTLSRQSIDYQTSGEIIRDGATGAVTFRGTVRLKFADGEVVAEGGTLTAEPNGIRYFSSDELEFVNLGAQ